MTTVSALPPSATPTRAGGGKSNASEGGNDFAALLAGLATPPGGAVTTPGEGGTPDGAPVGVVLPLVVDLSQLDLAGAAAAQAPALVPGQPAAPTTPAALPVQPVAVPATPAGSADDVALAVAASAVPTAAAAVAAADAAPVAATTAGPTGPTSPAAATATSAPVSVPAPTTPAETALGVVPTPQTGTTGQAQGVEPKAVSLAPAQSLTPQPVTADAAASQQPAMSTGSTAEPVEPAAPTSLKATTEVVEATEAEVVDSAAATSTPTDADAEPDGAPQPQVAAPTADVVRAAPSTSGESFAAAPVSDSRTVSAPAAPAPPAPPAPAPPPATQVLTQLGPTLEGPDGTYTMSLQLYPEDLGAVQVEVSLRGGEISLALHAADDVAKELLRASLAELREQLEATGLTATDVSVDSGEAQERDPAAAKHANSSGGTGDGDDTGGPAPAPATDPDAALDVRI